MLRRRAPDAAHALTTIGLQDKDVVRAALRCALVKSAEQLDAFDLLSTCTPPEGASRERS